MDFLTKVINNAGIKEFLCGVGSRLAAASHEFADQWQHIMQAANK